MKQRLARSTVTSRSLSVFQLFHTGAYPTVPPRRRAESTSGDLLGWASYSPGTPGHGSKRQSCGPIVRKPEHSHTIVQQQRDQAQPTDGGLALYASRVSTNCVSSFSSQAYASNDLMSYLLGSVLRRRQIERTCNMIGDNVLNHPFVYYLQASSRDALSFQRRRLLVHMSSFAHTLVVVMPTY